MCYNTLWCWKSHWIPKLNSKLLGYIYIQNNLNLSEICQNYCSRTQTANDDLNVKTGWYHAKQDTLPHFLLKTKEEEKGGRVSPLAWYQPVLMFRSVVCRLGPGTVLIMPFKHWIPVQTFCYNQGNKMRKIIYFFSHGSWR